MVFGAYMKVLIVDDTKTSLLLIARILEKHGHRVKAVDNAGAALEQLTSEDFDLVLMDIQMPVMSGIEAARIIRSGRSSVRRRDIPILAVSAGIESDRCDGRMECLNAGMNGYLRKPVNSKEFIEIVEHYQSGHSSPLKGNR